MQQASNGSIAKKQKTLSLLQLALGLIMFFHLLLIALFVREGPVLIFWVGIFYVPVGLINIICSLICFRQNKKITARASPYYFFACFCFTLLAIALTIVSNANGNIAPIISWSGGFYIALVFYAPILILMAALCVLHIIGELRHWE